MPYWSTLDRWRRQIRGPRLRTTLGLLYDDDAFRRRFEECPGSTTGHHAELGGLLRHTLEVAIIAREIARVSRADSDLVLAGVLLHDIGKLEAYHWDGAFSGTDGGALIGHVVLGSLMLERRVRRETPPPCSEQELTILQHLILSHHGRPEYGAPVPPMTLEAEILHYADSASAKAASMMGALADPDNFTGSERTSHHPIWQIDRRRAYRGGSGWGADPASAEETT
jgi:3'-5' exoribonuclease